MVKENELLRNQLHQMRIALETQYLRNLEVVKKDEHKIAQLEKDVIRLQGINKELEDLNLRITANQKKSEEKIKKLDNIIELHGIKIEKDNQERIVWPPRGAVSKIKQQPAYRLGAILVSRFKSPAGLLGIPMAIRRETRRLHQERQLDYEIHMQSLHQYRDWADASRIQDQLSYRLGSILVEKSRSPVGWISLPVALIREVRAFNKRRKPDVGGSAKTND